MSTTNLHPPTHQNNAPDTIPPAPSARERELAGLVLAAAGLVAPIPSEGGLAALALDVLADELAVLSYAPPDLVAAAVERIATRAAVLAEHLAELAALSEGVGR